MNCPSFYLQSKYGRMTRFLSTQELPKAKKICTQYWKTAHKNQICSEQEFAHSRNLLTEFARSIEKLLTMKNLADSDGSTRLLSVSHQANQSTAGAHHSTVSVVTAGTCWARPSCSRHFLATRTSTSICTVDEHIIVGVWVNLSVRRADRDRVRVSNQDVVETGYAPSS
jgi:hypothetical protein